MNRNFTKSPLRVYRLALLVLAAGLPLGARAQGESADAGLSPATVIATVEIASQIPDPQFAGYKHCLTYLKFKLDEVRSGSLDSPEFVAVMWAFRDWETLDTKDIGAGDRLELRLTPYDQVANQLKTIMRVDDTEDYASPVFWVEDWKVISSAGTEPPARAARARRTLDPAKLAAMQATKAVAGPRADAIAATLATLRSELECFGGSWQGYQNNVAPFRQAALASIEGLTFGDVPVIGTNGWLYVQRSIFSLEEELWLTNTPATDSDLPFDVIVDFAAQLSARGVDFIFMPIPDRIFLFPENVMGAEDIPEFYQLAPRVKKLMLELSEAGIEVVDILRPFFMTEKAAAAEQLYHEADTHWSTPAIMKAAEFLADRLRRYDFVQAAVPDLGDYIIRDVPVPFDGWLVGLLPPAQQVNYPPIAETWKQVRVGPLEVKYVDVEDSPILIMGDSNAGHEKIPSASFSAHLARETAVPITLRFGAASGHQVPQNLAREGAAFINSRRVVVWSLNNSFLDTRVWKWQMVQLP